MPKLTKLLLRIEYKRLPKDYEYATAIHHEANRQRLRFYFDVQVMIRMLRRFFVHSCKTFVCMIILCKITLCRCKLLCNLCEFSSHENNHTSLRLFRVTFKFSPQKYRFGYKRISGEANQK